MKTRSTFLVARVIPKRAMVVCFTRDENSVLVGDKTGEVHLLSLTDWTSDGDVHLLGHFSMLLDMVTAPITLPLLKASLGVTHTGPVT